MNCNKALFLSTFVLSLVRLPMYSDSKGFGVLNFFKFEFYDSE
jgi:hypothetical protein